MVRSDRGRQLGPSATEARPALPWACPVRPSGRPGPSASAVHPVLSWVRPDRHLDLENLDLENPDLENPGLAPESQAIPALRQVPVIPVPVNQVPVIPILANLDPVPFPPLGHRARLEFPARLPAMADAAASSAA